MTTWLTRGMVSLWSVLPLVPVAAVAANGRDIERLVNKLGSDDFNRREEATKRLKAIGEPALDALRRAEAGADAEARRRARDLVAAIESELYAGQPRCTGHTDCVWVVSVSA